MTCILCHERRGTRPALVLPCDQHMVCWLCVQAAYRPYTDSDAQEWVAVHSDSEACRG